MEAETTRKLTGVAASEGIAIGPVFVHAPDEMQIERENIPESEVEREMERFERAVESVVRALTQTRERLEASGNDDEAAIFDAHIELATDPEFASGVRERVEESLQSPESATLAVGEEYASLFASMDDEYLAARADDVRDVSSQIAAALTGRETSALSTLEEPSVIAAKSLAPSDTARIPKGSALAFITAEGSKTSHVSIMARSMGIPAVVGVGEAIEEAFSAETIAIDGGEGYAVADPDSETLSTFERLSEEAEEHRASLEEYRHIEARTSTGARIEISANIGSAKDAPDALEWGAEGVGLFRTEFLFMERDSLPTEEEQYEAYREVVEAFAEKPVIVRTLDVGGDKDLPGVEQPEEENPFLGWRGIRMCLDTPEIFKPQLRALLRAASHGNLKVMFPMIAEVGEVRAAKRILKECEEELQSEGIPFGEIEVGVMVETPAAALCAAEIAKEVSFFSIGTNDLVQYTLAADRGNEKLERLQSADHPAVMAVIELTCRAAKEAGVWVGMCGEAAADPELIPRFVEMGVTEVSMSAPSIPRAKKTVAQL